MSRIYKLTVFEPSGEKLLDESFTAENDKQAKELGQNLLNEKNYQDQTHRCTSPSGTLLLFHR
ncbi:YhzD family protein [Peribacillus sp. NPDC006672]|uniref:YhzD family protein n=1 Tax=Peribacillus sp. NPDC006672 TaxID=3390606 RepID=UPI003D090760